MLSNLKIENIAVIETASINFTENLNCFSGETGAGKSIIIDAINAILGEKTSRELIRTGADSAKVTALFLDISEETLNLLEKYDLPIEPDNSLLIQRSLLKGGRNICKINGEPVTVSFLKAIASNLISIHGQNDSLAMFSPEKHYKYIDSLANNSKLLNDYQLIFNQRKALLKKIKDLELNEQAKEQKIDILTYQINELESANILIGEIEDLVSQQELAQNAQKITYALNAVQAYLKGSAESLGAADLTAQAAGELQEISPFLKGAEAIYKSLYEASISLSDASYEISDLLFDMENDLDIDYIEERLDLLYRLRRKYGDTEEEMLLFLENAKKELEEIESLDESILNLKADLSKIEKELKALANKLSDTRHKTAKIFEKNVIKELEFLDMPNIQFIVDISQADLSETGSDSIEFLISPNLGEEPKQLAKIASGGELSRIMLAIKTVLAEKDQVQSLIFDEIDTGVSGRAAEKIGLKLKEASKHRQVICVTHLAQIAALADNHLFIEKEVRDNKTYTKVSNLKFKARVKELARILGGIEISDLQLQNAKEMLIKAGHRPE